MVATRTTSLALIRKFRNTLPSRSLRQRVMAVPPTVTYQLTNTNAAGRFWPPMSNGAVAAVPIGAQFMSTTGGFLPIQAQAGSNNSRLSGVTYGGGSQQSNFERRAFYHYGTSFSFQIKDLGAGNLLCKVDDEYVSLTAQAQGAFVGNFPYWNFTFASAALRRIEIISTASTFWFGLWAGLTDAILPTVPRGPCMVVLGESYGEGTGATASTISGCHFRMAEALGIENWYSSCVGSTGLLANAPPKAKYRDRFVTDVLPLAPDVVFVHGSINDAAFTPAQLATEALALIALGRSLLPNVIFIFSSEPLTKGATTVGKAPYLRRDAVKAAVVGAGHIFIDRIEMPLPAGFVPNTSTLQAAAALNATTLSFNTAPLQGAHYAFADGTRFLASSYTGTGPFAVAIDGQLQAGQLINAVVTQVGDCPWSGTGFQGAPTGNGTCDVFIWTDTAHPSQAGHDFIGQMDADLITNALKAA